MSKQVLAVLATALSLMGCASPGAPPPAGADARAEVLATERAFARTMAERDHAAFASFVSEEAVFFSGDEALRGKARIVAYWARFFGDDAAPFSWEPELVEVLDSGALALSSGPVHDATGRLVARFTSIWRREAPGTWRIVFDQGNDVCD